MYKHVLFSFGVHGFRANISDMSVSACHLAVQ